MNSNHEMVLNHYRAFNSNVSQRVVYIEYECLRVGEIDTMNQKYYAEYLFTFSWNENEHISFYDKRKDWNPLIFYDNFIGKPDEIEEYELKPKKTFYVIYESYDVLLGLREDFM